MSGDSPKWLEELESELGLGDTPAPVGVPHKKEMSIAEAVENLDFGAHGWARIRDLILKADEDTDITLFHRIITANDDDAMLFVAMVGLPYYLAISNGYDKELSRKLITFVAASYVIAMRRGHALGIEDAKD